MKEVKLINFHCIVDYENPEIFRKKLLFIKAISMDADDFLDFVCLAKIHTTKIG